MFVCDSFQAPVSEFIIFIFLSFTNISDKKNMKLSYVILIFFIIFVQSEERNSRKAYPSEKLNDDGENPKNTLNFEQDNAPEPGLPQQSSGKKATAGDDKENDSSSSTSSSTNEKESHSPVTEEKFKQQTEDEANVHFDQNAEALTRNASKSATEDISLSPTSTHEESYTPYNYDFDDEDPASKSILLISLGGGEDEILVAQIAWLLYRHEKKVTVLLYGKGTREANFPKGAKIINIPVDKEDPLRPEGKSVVGLTPEDASRGEWVSGRILWARIAACRRLGDVESNVAATKPSIIVFPLFLHDVCVLSLAHRLKVPVVGLLTSRVGAWWTWAQLGVLPPLSTIPVPLTSLKDGGLWDRAANLGHHYNYMASLRQQWQVKAMTALPHSWNVPSLVDLYALVSRLLYSWDPLVDPFAVPVPSAIPIGGFASTFRGEIVEDVLSSAIVNRAGIIVVLPGTLEVWVGWPLIDDLKKALEKTSFTVIWKSTHPHLMPNKTTSEEKKEMLQKESQFIFTRQVPLNEILNHPRHRLLVSTCGESDIMAAVHFGSPLLCLPVTTDQHLAATEVKRLGMGEMLVASEATLGKTEELVHQLTSKRSYRLRARELAEDLHDQPLTPSERLLFHIENVIRKPQSVRHKICGSSLPLLQQTNADVYLVIVVLLTFLLIIVFIVFVNLLPYLSSSLKVKKD